MKKKVLVIGGTGMLGQPVVLQLLRDGFDVRVMTRNPGKAKHLSDQGAEIVKGDIHDTLSIDEAMEDVNIMHINLGQENELIGTLNLAFAIKRNRINRISMISGATVSEQNRWHHYINQKYTAEQILYKCGVPYTIFCPTWFMESLPMMVKKGKAFIIGKQPHPFHWLAAKDYAQMVSRAYQVDESKNKRFIIHGPDSYLMGEALQKYIDVLHPEIDRVKYMPIGLTKFLGFIMFNKSLKTVASLFGYFEKVGEMGDPTESNKILGKPSTTLEEWIGAKK